MTTPQDVQAIREHIDALPEHDRVNVLLAVEEIRAVIEQQPALGMLAVLFLAQSIAAETH